jgi:hypothetical protein
MDRFIAEGHLPGFKALANQSSIYVTDAGEQPPNLEPWIQWVTVHTGMPFAQHRVFDLGNAHKLRAPRIWDLVVEQGRSVWICGSMNADLQVPSQKARFLPDPWSSEVKPLPPGEYDTFCRLAWKYVQEHARASPPWSKRDYAAFLIFMLRHGLSMKTVVSAVKQIAQDVRNKQLRWRRATILDRLQWDLFRHTWKKVRPDFSTFFLNSTAHFQHYHWRDIDPHLFSNKSVPLNSYARDAIVVGYRAMDDIVRECMAMAPNATIVLITALSQQPLLKYETVGGKCIFKPIDPAALMQFAGVTGSYKYAPMMAEEFRLYFDDNRSAEEAFLALMAMTLDGKPLMRARLEGKEIFGGCDVITAFSPDELVRSALHYRTERFGDLFYQAEGAKSGCHHPDGIFWIHIPGVQPARDKKKLSLVTAAHKLAELAGVEFDQAHTQQIQAMRLSY